MKYLRLVLGVGVAASMLAISLLTHVKVDAAATVRLALAGWPAPPALPPKRPVTDTYAGVKVVDPYRYFENMKDPKVLAFFRSENAYARAVLAKLEPGRARLRARIVALDNAGPSVGPIVRDGDLYFYQKRNPEDNADKLYVRHAGQSDERVLVDPQKLVTKAGQHFNIDYFLPSWDGAYVAYGISEGGSENADLHVIETQTGTVLPDTISRAKYVGASGWRSDSRAFYYLRFPKLAPGESSNDAELKPVSYLHVIGADPEKDPPVFGYGVDPALTFQPTDFALVVTSPASSIALGVVAHGVQNEETVYAAPAASVTGAHAVPWKKVVDVGDDVTAFDVSGSTLYAVTHKDASTFKVVAIDLNAPDFARAPAVVPASRAIVEQVQVAQDGLYVLARDGGFGQLERVTLNPDGTPASTVTRPLPPYPGAISGIYTDPRVAGVTFPLTSWTKSLRYFAIDSAGVVRDTGVKRASSIDTTPYTSEESFATSADGTKVPISIVYPKNIVRDGSHPAYLEGYGAYGVTLEPGFLGDDFAWLERGGVWAVCHTRGGGWFGEDWHRAGMIATKQHTIDDFIACGKYLVAEKFTSPKHLAGEGTSAGGITIGRSITEAPSLFAAALDVVGVSDAVRSEFSPNGPPNVPEFGSVRVAADVKPLINMDTYLNVRDGTAYPAVMLITGINDPRVAPWELAKLTARLQEASTSGRPVLLRVDYDAGHGFLASSRAQGEDLLTDQFSFLLWQLGDPLFANHPTRIEPH